MFKLRNICKYYYEGKNKRIVLDNINIDFKNKEMVFILGSSGSGKSTLLNIIAGNLKQDSGEIILDNEVISSFKEKKMNYYRNGVIGNVFQDYNLINNLSVMDNILLASAKKIDKVKLTSLLKQLNIFEKRNEIVSKLSGGEKQRVSLCRALINDPKIIVCDEPTGALDSQNGIIIMDLLKRISKNKLVIVVSHDENFAYKYADRVINLKDGKCKYEEVVSDDLMVNVKKSNVRLSKILSFVFHNIFFRKSKTLLTILALFVGLFSISLVISLGYGFNKEIDDLEKRVVSVYPITIYNGDIYIDDNIKKSDNKIIYKDKSSYIYTNKINDNYLNYLNKNSDIKNIVKYYDISIPIINKNGNILDSKYFNEVSSYDNLELLYGRKIENKYEILLKVDSNNNVYDEILKIFDVNKDIEYKDMIGKKIRVLNNNLYYSNYDNYFYINTDLSSLYNKSNYELEIVGIVREKEVINDSSLILYNSEFVEELLNDNKNSYIVNKQIKVDYNVLGLNIKKEEMLNYLGYNSNPCKIELYVYDMDSKERVINYLDNYSNIKYVDTMKNTLDTIREFILIIETILIIFSIIAIFISLIMITMITSNKVLEKKKDIGILRSLGFSKKNIKTIFNLENIIMGIIANAFNIVLLILLKDPINNILYKYLEMEYAFSINYFYLLIEFIIFIFIIKLAGMIPIRRAGKLNITDCIYDR